MITGLPEKFSETINQNSNLDRYLLSLTQAVPSTKRSWLYESKTSEWILNSWKNRLATLETGSTFEREVFQFDISSEEKWGSQGGHAPMDQLFETVIKPSFEEISPSPSLFGVQKKYLTDIHRYVSDADWSMAIESVSREYKQHQISGIRPASLNSVVEDMRARDTLESNSGWPDFARRNLPEVKEAAMLAAKDGSYTEYPAIALFRTYRKKTRLVWMFPMAANLVEGAYYQPLQSAIIKAHIPFYAPWEGFEVVRKMISNAYDSGKVIAATDFSSTDAHFKLPTSAQAYYALEDVLQNDIVRQGFWQSLVHMHSIPLIIGPDQIVQGMHGVSSGSNWTNFIETVFDHILAKYAEKLTGYKGFYAIGDDMAWISDSFREDFSTEIEEIGTRVGQVIKAEKATNDPDKVKSLQRLFQRGYKRPDGLTRGVYPTIRALNSSVFPERFHNPKSWSPDMFCARQYMILENCVDHPLFEEFVKFVVQGQKDLIPFSKKSETELARIHRQSKLIPGLNPTYNQEKRDSALQDFESIRIARSL